MFFQLSKDQIKAVDGICTTLVEADPDSAALAVLTGSAGTGKTTVIFELMQRIRKYPIPLHIELCATTHRAAAVSYTHLTLPTKRIV